MPRGCTPYLASFRVLGATSSGSPLLRDLTTSSVLKPEKRKTVLDDVALLLRLLLAASQQWGCGVESMTQPYRAFSSDRPARLEDAIVWLWVDGEADSAFGVPRAAPHAPRIAGAKGLSGETDAWCFDYSLSLAVV